MTSPVTTRRRRLEPDERRRQILAAAIELFGEKPYPMVSTIELAERAGVARGLINHYFGNKRELYLEVMRQLVMIAPLTPDQVPQGSVEVRAAAVVDHFLDLISRHGRTWLAAVGAEGVGGDPEVEQILAEADDRAADWVVEAMGLYTADERLHAMVRMFGGLIKAGGREWITRGTLTRDDLHLNLTQLLVTMLREVLPRVPAGRRSSR